jgi:tRNA threonylcarbamoyladenosine modification (KEOPS) complex Cgi121 subunit
LPPDPQTDPADFAPTVTINQYDSGGNVTSTANYEIDLSSADLTQFDFSVDLGGIQVQLDIGGISIGGGGEGEGIKPLRDVSFPEVDCGKQKPFDEEELEKEELEEEELETEEEERLAWVAIAITQLPIQGKTVLQKNALDNDYFAGYLAFTVTTEDGNFQLPPEPVKKSNAIFKAPIGATGFRAYSVNGAKLKATIYREKVEVKE